MQNEGSTHLNAGAWVRGSRVVWKRASRDPQNLHTSFISGWKHRHPASVSLPSMRIPKAIRSSNTMPRVLTLRVENVGREDWNRTNRATRTQNALQLRGGVARACRLGVGVRPPLCLAFADAVRMRLRVSLVRVNRHRMNPRAKLPPRNTTGYYLEISSTDH